MPSRSASTGKASAVAAILILALAFQGTRGLWEPDEGFYANVALGMLRSGDWWVPRLNGEPFLDKPPLLYWGATAGLALLGVGEWGARLANALFFAATALLVGGLGSRMRDAAFGQAAALAYATTLAPFLAANVLTPDTPLAACVAIVYYTYWRAELPAARPRERRLWWLAAGAGAGLGFLAKGPALLVFLPPLGLHLLWQGRLKAVLREGGVFAGAAAALACAAAWYGSMASILTGALTYMADNQILGRLVSPHYERNASGIGALKIYLPTLLVGGLPWSLLWVGRARRLLRRRQAEGFPGLLPRDPASRLILLWFFLPLPVLAVARSRLPLYLLPLFMPLALAGASWLKGSAARLDGRSRYALLTAWCLLLLTIKAGAAWWPAYADTRRLARELPAFARDPALEVVAVDVNRNALPFYGFRRFEWVTTLPEPYPYYVTQETLAEKISELRHSPRRHLFIVSTANANLVSRLLKEAGVECRRGWIQDLHLYVLCEPASSASASTPTIPRNSSAPLVRSRERTRNQPPRARIAPSGESGRSLGKNGQSIASAAPPTARSSTITGAAWSASSDSSGRKRTREPSPAGSTCTGPAISPRRRPWTTGR